MAALLWRAVLALKVQPFFAFRGQVRGLKSPFGFFLPGGNVSAFLHPTLHPTCGQCSRIAERSLCYFALAVSSEADSPAVTGNLPTGFQIYKPRRKNFLRPATASVFPGETVACLAVAEQMIAPRILSPSAYSQF